MNDEYLIYGETLKGIADSIRSVSSVSTTWTPDEMAAYILANLVKPTTRQAAKTYTPSTSNQTIPVGTFLTGAATIAGDADLTAANIVKGKNIFNVAGSASGIFGNPSNIYDFTIVKSGSFTTTSSYDTDYYTITHGLGKTPKLMLVYREKFGSIGTNGSGALFFELLTENVTTYSTGAGTNPNNIYLAIYYYRDPFYNERIKYALASPTYGALDNYRTMLNTGNNYTMSSSGGFSNAGTNTITMWIVGKSCTFKWLAMA